MEKKSNKIRQILGKIQLILKYWYNFDRIISHCVIHDRFNGHLHRGMEWKDISQYTGYHPTYLYRQRVQPVLHIKNKMQINKIITNHSFHLSFNLCEKEAEISP